MSKQNRSSPAPTGAGSRPRCQRLAALTLLLLSFGGASLAAGPLSDPTRPPAHLAAPSPSANNAPASPTRSPADATAQPTARRVAASSLPALSGVLLQSVQSPARGPAVAIINGQLVKIGDPVAGRLVLRIDAQGVLLQGSAGHERLWLLGDGTKQAAGSILSNRSAQFTPAPDQPEASTTGEAQTRTERSSTPGTIELARRTPP